MATAEKKTYLTEKMLAEKLAGIKALILDVDGVLTDDHLYTGTDGFEMKRFHIGDGLSMVLAMRSGLEIIIMSNRPSAATTTRMKDLRVKHVIQEHGNKAKLVSEYLAKNNLDIELSQTAFIGNDIMDVPLMHEVGIGIGVNDSYPELKEIVDYVTIKKGGNGAVREILDLYFKGKGINPVDFIQK
jgi:3-deoxy-D-manno-octulosonate 8-phosphate phosphatase (KDO 8-P phosphatase)